MNNKKIWRIAIVDGVLTSIYVAGVATLMTYANQLFGSANNVLGGAAILMLLVLSAVIVGTFILGRPLMMYLDGLKKEAIKTLGLTILVLFVLTFLSLLFLIIR